MNKRIKELELLITKNDKEIKPLKVELADLRELETELKKDKMIGKHFIRRSGVRVELFKVIGIDRFWGLITISCSNRDPNDVNDVLLRHYSLPLGYITTYCKPITKARFDKNMNKMLKVFVDEASK